MIRALTQPNHVSNQGNGHAVPLRLTIQLTYDNRAAGGQGAELFE